MADTSITMGFRPPQINDPINVMAAAESAKAAKMKNALAEQAIREANSPEALAAKKREGFMQSQQQAKETVAYAAPLLNESNWEAFGQHMKENFGDAGVFGKPYDPAVHEQLMSNLGIIKKDKEERPMNDLDRARADYLRYQMGVRPTESVNQPESEPPPQAKLSSAAEKELFDTTDRINKGAEVIDTLQQALSLNDKSYSGAAALQRAQGLSGYTPFESEEADNTIMLDNLVRGQALANLKLVFGGNPTEGERAMLLELQASANKTPSQRKSILERAIKMARDRIEYDRNKAEALTTGKYRDVDYIKSIGSQDENQLNSSNDRAYPVNVEQLMDENERRLMKIAQSNPNRPESKAFWNKINAKYGNR